MPNKKRRTKDPCWKGYKQVGMKTKNGRRVPNCVKGKKESRSIIFEAWL